MTPYEIITSVFWGAQLALIWKGLVQMGRASKEREPILESLRSSTEELRKSREESRGGLKELIEQGRESREKSGAIMESLREITAEMKAAREAREQAHA